MISHADLLTSILDTLSLTTSTSYNSRIAVGMMWYHNFCLSIHCMVVEVLAGNIFKTGFDNNSRRKKQIHKDHPCRCRRWGAQVRRLVSYINSQRLPLKIFKTNFMNTCASLQYSKLWSYWSTSEKPLPSDSMRNNEEVCSTLYCLASCPEMKTSKYMVVSWFPAVLFIPVIAEARFL